MSSEKTFAKKTKLMNKSDEPESSGWVNQSEN